MGKIIWLASYPKSGNTWMRAFLHNLLLNPDKPLFINELDTFCAGESTTQRYRELDARPFAQWSEDDVARMRPKVHERLTTLSPDNVFAKTHCALTKDHGQPTVNLAATAGAIYMIRNPLDIAISYAHHMGVPLDAAIELMALPDAHTRTKETFVREVRGSWSQHVASWTARPHPTLHVVRYEDMLAKPAETFAGVVRFLGLTPPEARLIAAIQKSSFAVLAEQEKRHGFKEKPKQAGRFFREGTAGQWRAALEPRQVAAIVKAHRTQMARFGYVPPGH